MIDGLSHTEEDSLISCTSLDAGRNLGPEKYKLFI